MQGQGREVVMKVMKIMVYLAAVLVFFGSMWGCGGKEERAEEEAEANTVSKSPWSSDVSPADKPGQEGGGLLKQVEEVRKTFISLQEVCKANDIEGYLDFWDDETKLLDGRDLSLEERRERRRKSLTSRPVVFLEIVNAKIRSITVETSQAEKLKALYGGEIKGTMMLVRTSIRAYLFHETDKGWKLFTIAPLEYFP